MAVIDGTNDEDQLLGTSEGDTINAFDSNDVLKGFGGADSLNGGFGVDTAFYGDSAARVDVDLLYGTGQGGSAQGDTLSSIENLFGSNFNDTLSGTEWSNQLHGLQGNDTLEGRDGSDGLYGYDGEDTLKGGGGTDVLDGGTGDDTAVYHEAKSAGSLGVWIDLEGFGDGTNGRWSEAEDDVLIDIEHVVASNYDDVVYGSNVNNIFMGLNGRDDLRGRGGNDTLVGGDGNDLLDGGFGVDEMGGGLGADTLVVDHADDKVFEWVGEGVDTVLAEASYTLAAGAEIEILQAAPLHLTIAVNLTGNEFNNTIVGNAGANVINGGGGADTMNGGGGNDIYRVDNALDRVFEEFGPGTDTVITSVSYALLHDSGVDVLRTTGSASTQPLNLTGSDFDQIIQGNAGANTIDGRGGYDTMYGFAGNDSYVVDESLDRVIEATGGGTDAVIATTSYVLAAGTSIELLRTLGSASTYAVNLYGNALANTIQGNGGANVLSGGLGNDTMSGFGGSDIFRFNAALGSTNVDRITDFNAAADTIQIDNAYFTGLANGPLAAGAFRIGSAAADANDRIVYNPTTGALIFDSNGNATGGATQFATLATGLALTYQDFVVI